MSKLLRRLFLLILCGGLLHVSPEVHAEEYTELEETADEIELTMEGDSIISDQAVSYNDEELFAEYVEQTLEEAIQTEGAELYQKAFAANRYSYLSAENQVVYQRWLTEIKTIANGSSTSATIKIPLNLYLTQYDYTASELGLSSFGVANTTLENAIKSTISPDFYEIYMALLADCPYEMYWHDKTVGVSMGYSVNYGIHSNGVEQVLRVSEDSYILLRMTVAEAYRGGSEFTTNATKTKAATNTVKNANAVVQAAKTKSDYQKMVYYRDWIMQHVSYNFNAVYYPTAYGDPWQMIYVFDGDSSTNVTCEGYAKAFKYLCDLSSFANSDIDCYLVTGNMDGEAHMWNVVFMDDKQNYMVDVTNYNSSHPKNLFLSGYKKMMANGYEFAIDNTQNCKYIYDDDTLLSYSVLERTIAPYNYGTQSVTKDPVEAFVTRAYRIVLQREPDAAGLKDWTAQLKSGKKSATEVLLGFYLSKELMGRNLSNSEYVELVYLGLFDRASDAAGKAHWVNSLDNGMSYTAVLYGFNYSAEFQNLCARYGMVRGDVQLTEARDQNANLTAFVNRLYKNILGRDADEGGLNNWCGSILSNPSRDNILQVATNGFLHSQEFKNQRMSNVDYVKTLYCTFLNRRYDEAGLKHWVNLLDQGARRDDVAWGFANSNEFNNLMTSYGL